ncbi:hypothetical protein L6452_25540 [Arctium lappa]|uniref:Uncharacterized protein n=1 Tax=Arctium lappa TaxID=4217 RepID=A0ACB9AAF9_ARCLA|nr:hypothetical protein L6452_25540 [Arctium lappa]
MKMKIKLWFWFLMFKLRVGSKPEEKKRVVFVFHLEASWLWVLVQRSLCGDDVMVDVVACGNVRKEKGVVVVGLEPKMDVVWHKSLTKICGGSKKKCERCVPV